MPAGQMSAKVRDRKRDDAVRNLVKAAATLCEDGYTKDSLALALVSIGTALLRVAEMDFDQRGRDRALAYFDAMAAKK